ncbi:MAG TPA: cytochrome C [Desulfobulbaceae bacterium]|nr:cytochrome C [Desulfobulbaceae bacterium]
MNGKMIIGGAILLVGAAQFVPYGRNHDNPDVRQEVSWDSRQTKEIFYRACGDCHSNMTKWPWYSNIAPASWLITRDVTEGRKNFNVSMWGVQKVNKGAYASYQVQENKMPPPQYLLAHPEAKLSKAEKESFIKGLKATFE